jgi:hypothetical protein
MSISDDNAQIFIPEEGNDTLMKVLVKATRKVPQVSDLPV